MTDAHTPLPPSRLHGTLLAVGLAAGAVLLGRLAFDIGRLGIGFAVTIWTFYGVFVVIGSGLVVAALRGRHAAVGRGARTALVLAIPGALLGTTLSCMGLTFIGCTPVCGFLMKAWSPLLSVLVLLFLVTRRDALLVATSALAFVLLVPNCVCRNPANSYWLNLLGESPACYAAAFGVIVLSLGALRTGRWVAGTIAVAWGAVTVMLAFFVGHHFFDFPW